MKTIETYRINGKWCVRIHSAALCGTFKTQEAAYKHGEWHLANQRKR